MTDNAVLGTAAALTLAVAAGWWFGHKQDANAQLAARQAAQVAEHRAGPLMSVVATQQIGPGQELRIVQIRTGPLDDGTLDPRCLVYTDSVNHTSSLTCPGVQALDLAPLP